MSTILTLSGVQFPAALNLPQLPQDGLDGPGVQAIYDFRRVKCLPAGNLVGTSTFANLSRNPTSLGAKLAGSVIPARSGNGLKLTRPNNSVLTDAIFSVNAFSLPSTQSFAVTAWFRQDDPADLQGLIGSGNNMADGSADPQNSFGLLVNGTNATFGITGWVWDPNGVKIAKSNSTPMPVGTGIGQVGMAILHTAGADSVMITAYNGVVVQTDTLTGVRGIRPPQYPLQFGTVGTNNQSAATIYRGTYSQLGGAGKDPRTPAQYFARDWALNNGQFV